MDNQDKRQIVAENIGWYEAQRDRLKEEDSRLAGIISRLHMELTGIEIDKHIAEADELLKMFDFTMGIVEGKRRRI